tara:strand:- start:1167 stop:1934 length:768 start_codon:yes stop_codon:yes gene_type:complete
MKVAVLIPGELRDVHNVKNLYEDCDVFIHSDKKYLGDVRYKMNRAYPIRWSFESFEGDDERRYKKYLENYSSNMHRIVQWFRYTKLLKKNLSGYDVIVRTRTDLVHDIDTLKGFLKDKIIEKDTLHIFKDWLWYGEPKTMFKTDLYEDIIFYIHRDDEYLKLDYNTILKSDLDSARFHWLNYPKQYINNWKTFKEDIKKNLDKLNNMKKTKEIFTKKIYSSPFPSEKIFLINMINQGIVCKNLGFKVELEKKKLQ